MPEITETDVKTEIAHALKSIAPDRLASYDAISDDQDLLEFIDSFGFVQLLMSIEPPLGVELDLTTVDLGSIVRFGALVGFVHERAQTQNAANSPEVYSCQPAGAT